MGRQLKRVPLDFNWPVGAIWGGYVNPFYSQQIKCPKCDGDGSAPVAKQLKDQWYGNAPFRPEDRGSKPFLPSHPVVRQLAERNCSRTPDYFGIGEQSVAREARRLVSHYNSSWSHHLNDADVAALIEADRLRDFTHTWTKENRWQKKTPPYIPTPQEVNEWSLGGFGHDSINQWVVVKAECARLGAETSCKRCDGEGQLWPTPEIQAAYENWEKIDPPNGVGYQVWETVSEGSPISPVFADPEALAEYLSSHNRGVDEGTTKEQWLRFILGPGWAPSLISSPELGCVSGVVAVVG